MTHGFVTMQPGLIGVAKQPLEKEKMEAEELPFDWILQDEASGAEAVLKAILGNEQWEIPSGCNKDTSEK
jgi:hypothetical protein